MSPRRLRAVAPLAAVGLTAWALAVAVVLGSLSLVACGPKAPPTLSPQATIAWHGTQVIKGLDVLRDAAISAHDQRPPLVSEATTRAVVQYHLLAIRMVHAAPSGWQTIVDTELVDMIKALPDVDRQLLDPYVSMVTQLLKAATR